jgi:hypothetical protein
MILFAQLKKFGNDESGAVTVDWVVLTAGIVGLGLLVLTAVSASLATAGQNPTTDIGTTQVTASALN